MCRAVSRSGCVIAHNASSIGYSRHANSGIIAHVVTINLADPEVRVSVALAEGGAGRSELFKSFVARTSPIAAITGTFFRYKKHCCLQAILASAAL